MYCKNCGKKVSDDSKYCKFCGELVPTQNEVADPEESLQIISKDTTLQGVIRCPICNSSDMITKVSASYSSGISTGSYSGSAISFITPLSSKESSSVAYTPVRMSGYNISDLSKRLAPPSKPGGYSTGGCLQVFLVFLGLFGTSAISVILPLIFTYIGIFASRDIPPNEVSVSVIVMPIIGFIISIILIIFMWRRIINTNRGINVDAGKNKEKYESDIETWGNAIQKWDKLYCCFRDDIVFSPETGEHAPVDNIANLLY